MMKPGVTGAADFSEDGSCRFALSRTWDKPKGAVLFVGLNPSKAGRDVDDMTVVKGMGFARRWGFGGTMHGNAYPFITTYPRELAESDPDLLNQNDVHLFQMASQAALVVLAWGAYPQYARRFHSVASLLKGFSPVSLGRTSDGFPRHISRIGYDTRRELWRPVAIGEVT